MLFRQLFDCDSCTYTYLIASGIGREAVIIDPVKSNMDQYIQLFNELNLQLVAAIDTHTHADHITASGSLSNITACNIIMGEHAKSEYISVRLKESEMINIDGVKINPIYTPGHTDDSYSFLIDNKVFTGDTLLIRGTGRTDFQGGNPYAQYDSLFNKLLLLPDTTVVYPAHDYCGMTSSTIAEEIDCNPRLQVKSADEYAEIMNNLNLSKPKLMDIAIPSNLKCGFD